MRRAPIVVAATVAGFAGVLSFHTRGVTTVALGGTASTASSSSGSAGTSGTASTGTSGTSSAGSSGASGPGTSGATGTSGSGTSGAGTSGVSTTPTTAAPSAPATGVRSAKGIDEQFGYGALAVKVTVNGSRITDVSVASLQTAEPTSTQICTEVIPMLRSEVLSAQSARINGISGATYTSEAYVYSLQSALDKLHVK